MKEQRTGDTRYKQGQMVAVYYKIETCDTSELCGQVITVYRRTGDTRYRQGHMVAVCYIIETGDTSELCGQVITAYKRI